MSVKLVTLQYTFMFDPSESFSHLYQFEDMLGAYLKTIGFQAEEVKNLTGSGIQKMLLISKIEPTVKDASTPSVAKEPPTMTLNQLRDPKTYGKSG